MVGYSHGWCSYYLLSIEDSFGKKADDSIQKLINHVNRLQWLETTVKLLICFQLLKIM